MFHTFYYSLESTFYISNDTVGASVVVVVVEEDGCTMVHFIPLTGIGVPEVIVDVQELPLQAICLVTTPGRS